MVFMYLYKYVYSKSLWYYTFLINMLYFTEKKIQGMWGKFSKIPLEKSWGKNCGTLNQPSNMVVLIIDWFKIQDVFQDYKNVFGVQFGTSEKRFIFFKKFFECVRRSYLWFHQFFVVNVRSQLLISVVTWIGNCLPNPW